MAEEFSKNPLSALFIVAFAHVGLITVHHERFATFARAGLSVTRMQRL